ncbi:MAG: rRNA maturation RNase YbeY [Alphaproteobacteria bacterium]|nr:rRNA maturation RNase YbeY [Alphaproteobacteria bacterium]
MRPRPSRNVDLTVTISDQLWHRSLRAPRRLALEAAKAALDQASGRRASRILRRGGEIGVLLADDEAIRALNACWRGQDKPTNVLAFATAADGPSERGGAGPSGLGDMIVARETLIAEAAERRIPRAHHLYHLVVHGVLHVLGYDHQTERDAATMEALETRILAAAGIPDPYAVESAGNG